MTERVQVGGLQVAKILYDFVNNEAIPGTGVEPAKFWAEMENILNEFAPRNKALLAKRDEIQAKIDNWHRQRAGQAHDAAAYKEFLQEIGYLLPEGEDFQIGTQNVDPEIARSEEHTSELQSRPHLVCRLLLEKKKKNENKIHHKYYNTLINTIIYIVLVSQSLIFQSMSIFDIYYIMSRFFYSHLFSRLYMILS